MGTKFEEVIRACNAIEIELDGHANLREAESKFITLCGSLAKGTKYESEVNRVAELYLKAFKTSND